MIHAKVRQRGREPPSRFVSMLCVESENCLTHFAGVYLYVVLSGKEPAEAETHPVTGDDSRTSEL
jgi:hypothetical protein